MDEKLAKKLRNEQLRNKVVTAEEAASWIKDGMVLGMSGFTRAGDVKVVPLALVEKAKTESFKVDVYTGASLGPEVDQYLAEAGVIRKRGPFQGDPGIRNMINSGEVTYVDAHLSHNAELVRQGIIGPIDFAIIEAAAITEDGLLIPTTSVGNSPIFVQEADQVIIELNVAQLDALEGVHDIFVPGPQGKRDPIPMLNASDRLGTIGIPLDLDKVKGIVISDILDAPSTIVPADEETDIMANHLLNFLREEIKVGRLTTSLRPLQSGVGSVANAVLLGFKDSEFENLEVYSEVLQDAVFELMDAGKVSFASATSITLSEEVGNRVYGNFEKYADKLVLRPQEISNHPEIIRRLGLISVNTALELDIYGNVNSTHVSGTRMMNGIGGSGDFARNARLGIFVTKSYAKGGKISSIVPMVSHVDHTEHDVDIIVTEQGVADLRGLAPKERVGRIIENCAHPDYKEQLWAYFNEANEATGGHHTPHILEKALSWHVNLAKNGTMQDPSFAK
ncbi:acetyl-CoA hydrolase/transferase family protein [Lysinibacillus sphaericus]|uniref:Acetyl-CoA hydrolase n=2 Tax=Lysinibacillus TaxID=400634 RepID=A0A2S0K5I2_LYSSH|nr:MULTISPECIES: acetyl-CoA hydrolase/transferase family protein [Lysinibacillus]AVK98598.1 acetyl-CoA hydrolase [Lysinibacillus sphaericus]MED4544130.1 acetyl-CoA hydrolase/transferase family protein [Lysinibacillus sphaericus]TKI17322.1 acetyl-CoA hydrolase/transferase family protein [Lysinibacillus sphaericus]TKI48978.1 acetyl-CoA hydrolase/transferase family protein [Lysinibacillus tabacifolii]UDK95198.1 acetyl-CoA hydrolase/transferase family protein [Lysinibacillus sphaericus]